MYGAAKRGVISERDRDTNKGENRGVLTDREDALDDEVVEFLECTLVRLAEGCRELLARAGLGGEESLAGERETTEEPHETLGRGALLLPLLVHDEKFEGRRLRGSSIVASPDFLWDCVNTRFPCASTRCQRTAMLPFRSFWTGTKAADPSKSVAEISRCERCGCPYAYQTAPRRPGQPQGMQVCRRQRL